MAAMHAACASWVGAEPAENLTQAVVERIQDGLAIVLVGDEMEEWDFPAHLLPQETSEGSVLLLEGSGRDFSIVGLGAGRDSVEGRLGRGLSRKRPIPFPLPHRRHPGVPSSEVGAGSAARPSRLTRDLNRRPSRGSRR